MGIALLPTMLSYLLPLLVTTLVSGQDTYHCPDGWYWQEHHGVGHCFFFSEEQVTKNDAEILCSFHEGYLVEIDRVAFNYWIKSMLLELYTPEVDAKVPWGNQFWMGAVTEEHHSGQQQGTTFGMTGAVMRWLTSYVLRSVLT